MCTQPVSQKPKSAFMIPLKSSTAWPGRNVGPPRGKEKALHVRLGLFVWVLSEHRHRQTSSWGSETTSESLVLYVVVSFCHLSLFFFLLPSPRSILWRAANSSYRLATHSIS